MTRHPIAKAVAAVSLMLAAGIAAADTQSVSVSATIKPICKFNSGQSPALNFNTIDPSGTSSASASASVLYRCTNGTSATVDSSVTGLRSMALTGSPTTTLAYTLGFSGATTGTGTGFGNGNDLTLGLTGTITQAQYQNATAGLYSDNVTLTVSP